MTLGRRGGESDHGRWALFLHMRSMGLVFRTLALRRGGLLFHSEQSAARCLTFRPSTGWSKFPSGTARQPCAPHWRSFGRDKNPGRAKHPPDVSLIRPSSPIRTQRSMGLVLQKMRLELALRTAFSRLLTKPGPVPSVSSTGRTARGFKSHKNAKVDGTCFSQIGSHARSSARIRPLPKNPAL